METATTTSTQPRLDDHEAATRFGLKLELVQMLRRIPGFDPFWVSPQEYRFDGERARKAVLFFRRLRHVKGEKGGQPFVLERWQEAIVANLFGWLRKSDGTRRFRECLIYVPRKNGKTTIVAGIGLYLLDADD